MKKLILPFLIAVASAILVVAAQRTMCNTCAAPPKVFVPQDAGRLIRALGLSEAQAAELRKLQANYGLKLEGCCARHCAARAQLGALMFRDSDTNAIQAVIEDMCRAQTDSDVATLDHIRKVYSLLTPDQQKKYESMVDTYVCGMCPNGFTHVQQGRNSSEL